MAARLEMILYLEAARSAALPAELSAIPDGVAGIKATLIQMRVLARAAALDPKFVQFVRALVASADNGNSKNWMGQISRIHEFVRDSIAYVRDPIGMEWVQTPEATLQTRQGDCDDKSTLAAAMLRAIGHPSRFVAVGFSPGRFSHVFVETRVYRGKTGYHWIGLETTEAWPLGKIPQGFITRMVKDV